MNEYFVCRSHCPCCRSSEGVELRRASYMEAPLRDYLLSFYSPQGGVELEYLHEQDYILIKCLHCDVIYQREIPDDFLMHKLYEEWIDPKKVFELREKTRTIDYFGRLSSEIIRIVKYFGCPPTQLQFLDFSMGWGDWCRIAQAFGCTVHGTEFSAARANYARETGVHVIDYDEVPSFRYDFINTEQVFEHLPQPRRTLAYLKRSLKKEGILKISVPDCWDIMARLEKWDWQAPKGSPDSLNPVAPLEHVNCFNRPSLVRLAREFGLVPVDIRHAPSQPAAPRRPKERLKAILRPYWLRLRGILREQPPAKGTYLFLRAVASP